MSRCADMDRLKALTGLPACLVGRLTLCRVSGSWSLPVRSTDGHLDAMDRDEVLRRLSFQSDVD